VLAGQEKARLLGLDQRVEVSSLKFYYAEDDGGFPLGMTSERMPTFWVEFSLNFWKLFLYILFGGLECVCHSFAYVAHFAFLRDVWIRTQRAVVARRRASSLATHLTKLAGHRIEVFVTSALSAMSLSSTVFFYIYI
jgi:hypothetical protein